MSAFSKRVPPDFVLNVQYSPIFLFSNHKHLKNNVNFGHCIMQVGDKDQRDRKLFIIKLPFTDTALLDAIARGKDPMNLENHNFRYFVTLT